MAYVDSLTPHLFVPTAQRPVRAKVRQLRADTRVMPHSHPWAQVAISTTGVIQLTVDRGTYIVPPSRALWIPPGMEHAVTMVDDAELRTLYFHQPRGRCGPAALGERTAPHGQAAWRQCRVLEASDLLRAVVREMPTTPDDGPPPNAATLLRERHLSALLCDELARAAPVKLGVDLPHDKRLRQLCEAVLADHRDEEATLSFLHAHVAERGHEAETTPFSVNQIRDLFLGRLVIDYDHVFCMTITKTRSPIHDNAMQASFAILNDYKPVRQAAGHNSPFALRVIDTQNLFAAQGITAAVPSRTRVASTSVIPFGADRLPILTLLLCRLYP